MEETDWKDKLLDLLKDFRVIESSKDETLNNFRQFCEFIAEPAFESLSEELKKYKIKSKFLILKGKSISFSVNFARLKIDNFHYIICLPNNSLELKLKLRIRGRTNIKSLVSEREEPFMKEVSPAEILNLSKEDLIHDVIEHYRNFNYEALTMPE